jgi:hypothetical protein
MIAVCFLDLSQRTCTPTFGNQRQEQKLPYRRYNKQGGGCLVIYDGVVVYRKLRYWPDRENLSIWACVPIINMKVTTGRIDDEKFDSDIEME